MGSFSLEGFRTNAQNREGNPIDDALRKRAYEMLKEATFIYVSNTAMPFITGQSRDEWFVSKVKQIKERYLVPL